MVLPIVRVVLLSQLFLFAESVSLTYILKKENTHLQPSCIAEGLERYSAVGWIYPAPDDGVGLPNTSKFIHNIKSR